ncbi:MAG TPA: DinB family protein [Acidimicrobiales bacterium]
MVRFTGADDLASAEFVGADLHGARFRETDLSRAQIRGADLTGAEIDGEIDGLRIYGVEVAPLVEAELDRRHPERAALRARDADSMRTGWSGLEAMWAQTMERVAAMPLESVDVSVAGEWSFAETLRHLVFATDAWLGDAILGRPDAYHSIGVPFSGWRERAAGVVDLDATPSYDEVLRVRVERVGLVRDFLATLTDERLGEQRDSPVFVRTPQVPLAECLWIIVNEEWHHHQYAVRDLDAIEADAS